MLTNPEIISNKFKCNKMLANYLAYELHFPILGIKGKNYYFANTPLLKECLQKLPLWLRVVKIFT